MKKLLTAFVIAVFVAPLGAEQPAAKKPITHDVYDGWKSIQGTRVSRDGIWVAYALTPQDGDGELVVRNLKTSAEYRAPRGRTPVITPDSRFVVFEEAPLKADVDKARKAKRRPEEMPKPGVGIVDLSSGKVTTLAEHVKSFRLPEDPIRIVAYLAAPRAARPWARQDRKVRRARTRKRRHTSRERISSFVICRLALSRPSARSWITPSPKMAPPSLTRCRRRRRPAMVLSSERSRTVRRIRC